MGNRSAIRGLVAITALSVTLVTCGGDPRSSVPTGPSAPTPVSVAIVGPGSISPGQQLQYVARIQMSDGSIKDATPGTNVFWRSSNSSLLQLTSTGLATAGKQMGDVFITAEVAAGGRGQTRGRTMEVVITPDGTYRLVGDVVDAELPSQGLPGAQVEISPGSIAITTDFRGGFRLYGVPPNVNVRVTRAGYQETTRQLQLTGHSNQVFQLVAAGPPPSLGGNYTLTVSSGNCQTNMPTNLRLRQYDAVISQNGTSLEVTLTEPRFRINSIGRGNRFSGRALGAGAQFTLHEYGSGGYYYYYTGPNDYPSVAEQLSDGTYLITTGTVFMLGSNAALSGQLSGGLTRYDSGFPTRPFYLSGCGGAQMSLTPR